MRGGERQHDVVFGRRRLQLEIELAAEPLAEREAPGAVDAAAIGRMDHELHAARFVEEALQDQCLARRQRAEATICCMEIIHDLFGCGVVEAEIVDGPFERAGNIPFTEAAFELATEARNGLGQLFGSRRGLAEPERNGRRLVLAHPRRARRPVRRE